MTRSTPLVLVHGNPENAAVWGPLLGVLQRGDAVTLSPPGFGVPAPASFAATVEGYREWLTARLEQFREPVDLVGHGLERRPRDAGRDGTAGPDPQLGIGCAGRLCPRLRLAQARPGMAAGRTGRGAGQGPVRGHAGGADRRGREPGRTGPAAERVAAGMDDGMGQAVLSLLRSAAQPVMANAGRGLARARRRPGLALIALRDVGNGSGTPEQHRQAAEQAGAVIAELEVGHWWPVTDPRPAAQALNEFWSALTTQGSELADTTTEPIEENPR